MTTFFCMVGIFMTIRMQQYWKNNTNIDPTSKVAVIGGAGYVGSYLSLVLQKNRFEVTIFDKDPKLNADFDVPIISAHSRALTRNDLAKFGTIIFLGGCTGRKACEELGDSEVETEMVSNVIDVISKMSSSQYFIAASTQAVLEGTLNAKEDSVINKELLDTYSLAMFNRESRIRQLIEHGKAKKWPQISLLRFGTVVGNSAGQRTDLMFPSFFRSAYTTGFLKVGGHKTMRSFLTLEDLSNAITALIKNKEALNTSPFSIWNLASFNATVLKVASTIASITGATIDSDSNSLTPLLSTTKNGFSSDCAAFIETFNFTFEGTLQTAINEFDSNIPDSIIAKGPHLIVLSESEGEVIPCPVCGSTSQQTVLDLGYQPPANDFYSDINVAMKRPRHPLKLVRCVVCNHYHLSHVMDRGDLFENYIYESGTSATLSDYFEWLALKVIKESNLPKDKPGSILEIACNDGSQLDHYKTKGWMTFGVDPAANLAAIAAKEHTVQNGFWPLDFPELPRGDELTAITAQNVAAHVPDVVSFLKGCVDVMGPKTKLYIQTSQCNMQQLGQFDTVYHEHISFFTGHSFLKAAELAGLYILSFETTPIHGESCLVTMQLDTEAVRNKEERQEEVSSSSSQGLSPTLYDRLSLETKDGVTSDFFAAKFSAHANSIRNWIKQELLSFKEQGYVVGGYGAAAKGMVLLHFILNNEDDGSSYLDYVLDDAKPKQNMYCPGTVIPVMPTPSILELSNPSKPLVVLIFAWNFFDEIANNIIERVKGTYKEVTFLVPFPEPRVIRVDLQAESFKFNELRKMPYHPTPIPNPITHDKDRPKAVMISHQRNEELLMPFFIMNHAPMFDKVIMIDFESDDKTLEIIEKFAPPSWEVIPSSTGKVFDAAQTDKQVTEVEKKYPNDWLVALTTTEFLIATQLRTSLAQDLEKDKMFVALLKTMLVDGNNSVPLSYSKPLPKQRRKGNPSSIYSRAMHYKTNGNYSYSPGRHHYRGTGAENYPLKAFIMKFGFAPWPEVRERKMNVGETIPASDVRRKFGSHHTNRQNEDFIEKEYLQSQESFETDLCQDNHSDSKYLVEYKIFHEQFGRCE